MRNEIRDYLEKLMDIRNIKHISNKEKLVEDIYQEYCFHYGLSDKCGICYTVKEKLREKTNQYINI